MKVPKYVIEMLERAGYEYDTCTKNENYAAGYSISIEKSTVYTKIPTLESEINRLKKWVERNGGEMYILYMPSKTRYTSQRAIVTIFDPVMQHIEQYIKWADYAE